MRFLFLLLSFFLSTSLFAVTDKVAATITTAGQTSTLEVTQRDSIAIQVFGTFTGTLVIEATVDGTNWVAIQVIPAGGTNYQSSITTSGIYTTACGALQLVRIRASAFSSGSALVTLKTGNGSPQGTNIVPPIGASITLTNSGQTVEQYYATLSLSPSAAVVVVGMAGFIQSINALRTTLGFNTQMDTYTATGTGAVLALTSKPLKSFALSVKGTGAAPTSFTVLLQGSLDGLNWTTLLTASNIAPGDGGTVWQAVGASTPVTYIRTNTTGLTLGGASNIVVRALGLQ